MRYQEVVFSGINKFKKVFFRGKSFTSLKAKLFPQKTFKIQPTNNNSMLGAGFIHKGKQLITHTTLDHQNSALKTFVPWQILAMIILVTSLVTGIIYHPLWTAITVIGLLSFIYFIDAIFNLYLILRSLYFPPEISFKPGRVNSIDESTLPIYTILCPLYRESEVLPAFLKSMENLDWPKDKLEVILLLEKNDWETQQALLRFQTPFYIHTVIIPHSEPKTKPKACNYGLDFAHGKYLVIFDAEDRPDPDQLKKAYLGFRKSSKNIACLQAKLNYYNPHQNLLTRLFTAEYSLWFDIILTGLQSINTAIPLGGTSNHFKTRILRKLQGWDPFNVTEDCDLGIRLYKEGYRTAIIDSTTWEEANSNYKNWLRQRSRWIKGYFQTFFVHNRHPVKFVREQGTHALIFQLIIGARMSFMLINPFLWLMTISYFALFQIVGPTIESFYPAPIFYMAVFSLVFGNFMYVYNYMIGAAKRRQWNLIKFVFLIPIYWLMASISATIALYQLIVKPHYWEKTNHGLHLEKKLVAVFSQEIIPAAISLPASDEPISWQAGYPQRRKNKFKGLFGEKQLLVGGSMLILSNFLTNIVNFAFNTYLGRQLSFEDYGELSLFTSFLFIASIPLGALSVTVSHKVAYLFGKHTKAQAKSYLNQTVPFALLSATILSLFWLALIPLLINFFHYDTFLSFILFAPVWVIGLLSANFVGYLQGILSFGKLGLISMFEVLVKLFLGILLIEIGFTDYIVLVIPISMLASLLITWKVVSGIKTEPLQSLGARFDKSFFTASMLSGISTISFLGVDIILAKHFLSPFAAGQYGVLSLVGKMIFFGGSLLLPFIIPIVAKNEGAGKNSKNAFTFLFALTLFIIGSAFAILGIFGNIFVPLLFGAKSLSILPYLTVYLLAIGLFTLTRPIVQYYQAKKNYLFMIPGVLLCFVEVILLYLFHNNLDQFVRMIFFASAFHTVTILIVYFFQRSLSIALSSLKDFCGLFVSLRKENISDNLTNRILIFNWRDTKHKWAGGAEVYIHELAKRWVKDGNSVTVFCGNDSKRKRNEIIDGVQIYRRGGFFLVYFWAVLYYIVKFRGKYDVIIDCENGIPFFTPLYCRKPKFLLIHHVHQEVFRKSLIGPFARLATFLEVNIMPFVYKNIPVITVSPSSKEEILKHKLTETDPTVIYNGVDLDKFKPGQKSKKPMILYLGRLQYYKSLHIFINAAKKILYKNPKTQFVIAGEGSEKSKLIKYAQKLKILDKIKFLGKVTEEEKIKLFQKSWVFVNPSFMEGWGITTIEANACGTPAIASDVPGLRDSIKNPHTGFLVPYGKSNLFAEQILKLIKDKKLREDMSNESIRWAQNFTWEKSATEFYSMVVSKVGVKEKVTEKVAINIGN